MSPTPTAIPAEGVLSVSALLRDVRDLVEHRFGVLRVSGELSNFTRAASGHLYFTLKDETAQVDCVMFRGRAAYLDWEPSNGARVELRAVPTLYEPRGRFQLNVEAMRRAGVGTLYERFLMLKARLEAEGLFDPGLKRALPEHPRCVGVVTSLAAAALHDVLTTLARRDPGLPVVVYPAPVQGEGAARHLCAMIEAANTRAECDVLLLVRGGGSIEDLWQFNEESLARAIRASGVPVVVGVGHETDVTIADFAADQRAPTPTAAAELVSRSRAELRGRIASMVRQLARETDRRLAYAMQRVDALARTLVHPRERVEASLRELAQWRARLMLAAQRSQQDARGRYAALSPRLGYALRARLAQTQARLDRTVTALAGLDPHGVLARGYSLTQSADGAIVRRATQLAPGQPIRTTLAHGAVESIVEGIEPG